MNTELAMPEYQEVFGAVKSPYDVRDYKITALPKEELPNSFVLPLTPVKQQFNESTCVAFASSLLVEFHNQRQQNDNTIFSTEFIYGLREDGYYVGDGMYIRNALNTLLKYGDVPVSELSGNNDYKTAMKNVEDRIDELKEKAYPHRISAYFQLHSNDEIKTSLMKHGYVIASMPWHKDYQLKDNVYTYDANKKRCDHAIVIYGWNDKGWLVQNSWGIAFGDGGRFIIPFDFKLNEAWGVTDDIVNDDIKYPTNNKFVQKGHRIINWVVNLLTSIIK